MTLAETILRIIGAIAALAVVLFLAWAVLHWMGKRAPGMGGTATRSIKILDRVSTGRGSFVMLIRVQNKVMLVAQTEHAIEKLCEFDDPEGLMMPPSGEEGISFSSALKDAVSKMGFGKDDKLGKGGGK